MGKLFHPGRWRIRTQLMVAMQVLIVVLAVSCCMASYSAAKSNIERNYAANVERNLAVVDGVIQSKLESAITLLRETMLDDPVYDVMTRANPERSGTYDSAATHLLNQICLGVEDRNEYVSGVFLFDLLGRFHCTVLGFRNMNWYAQYYDPDALSRLDWVDEVAAARGREVFFGRNPLAPEEAGPCICFAKQIVSVKTFQPVGYMVVELLPSLFYSSIAAEGEFESETYALLDREGAPIYATRARGAEMAEAWRQGDEGYLFSSATGEDTGLTTLVGVSVTDLNGISRYIRMMTPLITVASVLVATLLSLLVASRLNRPLEKLRGVVTNLRDGERIEAEFGADEIGQVGNALKRSVNNNLELRERLIQSRLKEREAELQLLQSQINPHFLYNTLDSIYCKAVVRQEDEIAEMVLALSNLFKISLNKGRNVVTVREELKHVEKYMAIQRLRYKDRFELIVDVDEELMELHIIKLILQPFVENSMYHGLEPKLGGGYIEIQGERLENLIYFRVLDNGVGMDDTSAIMRGYGVSNVVDRIHLFYGEEYGISVTSVRGQRTCVELRIPVMKEDLQ